MKSRAFLVILIAVVFAASCRPPEAPAVGGTTREIRDALGRTIVVPEKIDRVISLAPSLTEMIFAAGAGDRLVGVTTYCNYPPEATSIEKVGDTQTPNIERIVALKPQVVFISTASQLEAFSKTLDEQGIAVYVTNPNSLDDVVANMRQLGELFDTRQKVDETVAMMASRISQARLVAGHDEQQRYRPRVFVQISNEPLFTIGKGSFLTGLIEQ